jgi:ATP-dependent Lon protease
MRSEFPFPQDEPVKPEEETEELGPTIEFIAPGKWELFVNRINRNKRENQALIDMAAAIEKAGGCKRLLQTLSPDWELLINQFEEMFPNFNGAADLLRDYFALDTVDTGKIHFPPLLLLGEAGIGKTGSMLSGSEKFWSNTRVGQIFEILTLEKLANPIIMLDEIDKVSTDSRYDPLAPLYTLLEPSSAKNFIDLSITDFEINASHINWIATANNLSSIPAPIQSRFTIVEIEKPTEQQATKIIRSIYKGLLNNSNWGSLFNTELDERVIDALLCFPPRTVKMVLNRALGSAVRHNRDYVECDDLCVPTTIVQRGIGFLAPNI